METKIKVETVGYYHQKEDMTANVGLLPKKLNNNRKYFENPSLKFPYLNLNVEVKDPGIGDVKLESLIDFIRLKGWPNGVKPDIVTSKSTLISVAQKRPDIRIQVTRLFGVSYLLKYHEGPYNFPMSDRNGNFGLIFRHFFTRNDDEELLEVDKTSTKAVFRATVPYLNGCWNILYSGEVPAVDDQNRHYDFRVVSWGTRNPYFWKNNSCRCYWKSVFGNAQYIIVGARTHNVQSDPKTRSPHRIPEKSVYEVERLEKECCPVEAAKRNPLEAWTVSDGENTIQDLLMLIDTVVTTEGHSYIISRNSDNSEWVIEEDSEGNEEFQDLVVRCIPRE
ncbi:hypothetical protein GCK72_001624 [Caenorhabditis remanei]|uniref:Decapping nuclease n=1 Tax=Caenorhabditis remanei TaxID=31234 RepID=A0A6A5HU01_CAERE|nr:hypothetical protein GCK72_001624 [Caenorhabditis remanei]KAF1769807.1 hypothetical protein GCK72_001624 [Caenorhabditis remanei]